MTKHMTLAEARGVWSGMITNGGGDCPCCDRWGMVYKRPLNKGMCNALVWLSKQTSKTGWIDVPRRGPQWLTRTNQLPTMKWWGLVERRPNDDPKKKHSGMWRVTKDGAKFAVGKMRKRLKVHTYKGNVIERAGPLVSISDVIEDFDYSQVMS